MIEWKARRCAGAYFNGDFFEIKTQSGYVMFAADPLYEGIVLAPNASNSELGEAIKTCLRQSRFLPTPELRGDLLLATRNVKAAEEWGAKRMLQFKYKNKTALYNKMHTCEIEELDDVISIASNIHDKLMNWTATRDMEASKITVPSNSSVDELGAALRAGFKACSGRGAEVLATL